MSQLILEDEDVELETALRGRIAELTREYREYLGLSDPPPQQPAENRRSR